MSLRSRAGWAVPLLAGALAGPLGCAHAPAAKAAGAAPEPRVLVTGSHMARPVSRTGLPVTDFSVKIYGRSELDRTGEADVANALRKREPALE